MTKTEIRYLQNELATLRNDIAKNRGDVYSKLKEIYQIKLVLEEDCTDAAAVIERATKNTLGRYSGKKFSCTTTSLNIVEVSPEEFKVKNTTVSDWRYAEEREEEIFQYQKEQLQFYIATAISSIKRDHLSGINTSAKINALREKQIELASLIREHSKKLASKYKCRFGNEKRERTYTAQSCMRPVQGGLCHAR